MGTHSNRSVEYIVEWLVTYTGSIFSAVCKVSGCVFHSGVGSHQSAKITVVKGVVASTGLWNNHSQGGCDIH